MASNVKKKGGKPTLVTFNIITNVGQVTLGHVNSHVNQVNVEVNVKKGGDANVSDTQHCH